MSFPRHGEIFPSDGGAGPAANAPAHRLDEFPGWLFLGGLVSTRARLRFTSWAPVCCNVVLPLEEFSSNGQLCLNCLRQPRGQVHIPTSMQQKSEDIADLVPLAVAQSKSCSRLNLPDADFWPVSTQIRGKRKKTGQCSERGLAASVGKQYSFFV
jgi:hypothetical protein